MWNFLLDSFSYFAFKILSYCSRQATARTERGRPCILLRDRRHWSPAATVVAKTQDWSHIMRTPSWQLRRNRHQLKLAPSNSVSEFPTDDYPVVNNYTPVAILETSAAEPVLLQPNTTCSGEVVKLPAWLKVLCVQMNTFGEYLSFAKGYQLEFNFEIDFYCRAFL